MAYLYLGEDKTATLTDCCAYKNPGPFAEHPAGSHLTVAWSWIQHGDWVRDYFFDIYLL